MVMLTMLCLLVRQHSAHGLCRLLPEAGLQATCLY